MGAGSSRDAHVAASTSSGRGVSGRTFTEPAVQEANDSGCIFYEDPATLRDEQIDPLLRDAVRGINKSGWVWTAESCQGHPDFDGRTINTAWEHNTRPMLRLVTRDADAGRMLAALARAAAYDFIEGPDTGFSAARMAQGLELWSNQRRNGWFEVLAYFAAGNVAARDMGCQRFERFAELVTP